MEARKKKEIGETTVHELKNALNAISGFAELLLDDPDCNLSPKAREYAEMIRNGSQRACAIIKKNSVLRRLEDGDFDILKEEVDVRELISDLVKMISQIEKKYRVTIELCPDSELNGKENSDPVLFQADQDLILATLENLLINAAEAADPNNKKITVTVKKQEKLTFTVHNYGEIAKQIRPRLFQKRATFGKSNGNGIGLYLARLVTEAHGGEISFSSVNGETSFIVQIPLKPD